MTNVEQAVFTSAETDRSAGYQLVAQSPGVCDADARELAVWGPSHDSLLELGADAVSFNFHPLPSGAFCVSRTMGAGWEYSGRGGRRVYTQCLIVPPDVLHRFANNPLALIRAALATGALQVHDHVPRRLDPLLLVGRAAPVDQTRLARLAANPGPRAIAALVQAAQESPCLAISGGPTPVDVIAGLMSCLPPECRTECTFSTGLKFSSRRPYRIVALSGDPAERRWVGHYPNVTVLELADANRRESAPLDGWARFIERVLSTGRTAFLATQLARRRSALAADDLSALGLQLIDELEATAHQTDPAPTDHSAGEDDNLPPADLADDCPSCDATQRKADAPTRADAAHARFVANAQATIKTRLMAAAPSKTLGPVTPDVLDKLERLDDAVYEAIDGHPDAMQRLESLWPEALAELDDDHLAESREQYLRYALTIWEDCAAANGGRNAARAAQALDVLCLLFADDV